MRLAPARQATTTNPPRTTTRMEHSMQHRLLATMRLQATNSIAADAASFADNGSAALVPGATPIPVPNLPSLYQLPSNLYATYRPVPNSAKASIWLFALIVATMTTRNVKSLAMRILTMTLSFPWRRKLFFLLCKTVAIGLLSMLVAQDLHWGPSRVTVQQLEQDYWLPSACSKFQVLNVATSNDSTIPLGVHYLQVDNEDATAAAANENGTTAIYVNHGFGASSLSWLPAMEPLASKLKARFVLGHDATGFGFTERPGEAEMFTYHGSAEIGLAVWNHVIEHGSSSNSANVSRVILMGHSMGSLATLRMALDMDESLHKHVILVSPALQRQRHSAGSRSNLVGRLLFRVPLLRYILDVPAAYVLRRIVGTPGAWRKGLQQAWGDPNKLLDSDVLRFQWPSIGKGWEMGLLAFSHAQSAKRDITDKELVKRVLQLPNTTFSVIVSSKDRVVPPKSIRDFFEEFPSVAIEEMEGLGHDPFEEDVPTFVDTVERIIRKQRSFNLVAEGSTTAAEA
ncbi:hypothetical protein MPSEU_000114000 [Mayamaea pseudoterrestris]|nr:hypothetical protein MPSEU_000114000 [Mayamaea pseudoterrestris]